MSVTSPVTGRVTGIVASGVTRAIGHRTRVTDADALAYIAAVEAADDEALESSIKVAYNNFIKGCKADGTWDAIKASCILAGARTLAGCLVPLVGTAPTNVGPFVTGDYNRITGLKGNGSTKYLNSNRNNNADPQDNQHLSIYLTFYQVRPEIILGVSGDGRSSVSNFEGNFHFRSRSLTAHTSTASLANGFAGVTRSSAANYTNRAGGTSNVITDTSLTPFNKNIGVFADIDLIGTSTARSSFYSIGESLNLANLDTRVTRLLCEIEFGINTGLAGTGYDLDTLKYVNAGYAAGGTLA